MFLGGVADSLKFNSSSSEYQKIVFETQIFNYDNLVRECGSMSCSLLFYIKRKISSSNTIFKFDTFKGIKFNNLKWIFRLSKILSLKS